MASRQTFWAVLAYSWTAFITVVLAGGGDGGGVEIALYAIFLGLVLLDWITYVRTHPDADLWLATEDAAFWWPALRSPRHGSSTES